MHQQPILNKYFDLPFPSRQDLFQLADTDCGNEAELFIVLKEAISKGLHGIA